MPSPSGDHAPHHCRIATHHIVKVQSLLSCMPSQYCKGMYAI